VLTRVVGLQTALLGRALAAGSSGGPTPLADEPLLTVPEVARRLCFAEAYVYELIRLGRLPAVRAGKYVRIRPASLREWVAAREGLDSDGAAAYGPRHGPGSGSPTAARSGRPTDRPAPRVERPRPSDAGVVTRWPRRRVQAGGQPEVSDLGE
jgi:excisionase family DNA binding protein